MWETPNPVGRRAKEKEKADEDAAKARVPEFRVRG